VRLRHLPPRSRSTDSMGEDLCCYLRSNPWIKDEIHPGSSTGINRTSAGRTKTIKDRCRRNLGRIWSYSAVLNIISLSWNNPHQQLSSRRETDHLSIPTSFIARLVPIFKIWEYSGESIPQSVQNGQCIPALLRKRRTC
jgi:hypothetical protein